MKNTITILALLIITMSFGQHNNIKGIGELEINKNNLQTDAMSIKVETESLEDLKSTFTIDDIVEILDRVESGETIAFKITCHNSKDSEGIEANVIYNIKGNTDDKEKFIKDLTKIREKAITYYKSQD